jgi:hypothetical protein
MDGTTSPEAPVQSMQKYRKDYRRRHDEFLKEVTKEDLKGILDVIVVPRAVDMTTITGTDREVAAAIDRFYANDGR